MHVVTLTRFRPLAVAAAKFARLPQLPLVFAEILDDERSDAWDGQQPLARRVNGEPAKITSNPATFQFLRHRRRRAAAAKTIQHQVVFVRGRLDDTFEYGFGFLCRVKEILSSIGGLEH